MWRSSLSLSQNTKYNYSFYSYHQLCHISGSDDLQEAVISIIVFTCVLSNQNLIKRPCHAHIPKTKTASIDYWQDNCMQCASAAMTKPSHLDDSCHVAHLSCQTLITTKKKSPSHSYHVFCCNKRQRRFNHKSTVTISFFMPHTSPPNQLPLLSRK